ncbi:hypothetical protein Btru_062591 [Bulinus truncatus]|nr:hypothetical protein Btru_062591 [Bulinus truncatus]
MHLPKEDSYRTIKDQACEYYRAQCELHYDSLKLDNLHRKKYDQKKAEKKALKIFRRDTQIDNDHHFFKQCQVFYNVNNQMRMHPRAFAQLTDTDKDILMKGTLQIDNQEITYLEISDEFKSMLHHYRLDLDCQFPNQLISIIQTLNIDSLDDYLFNGLPIFRNLRPYQVEKLSILLTDSCDTLSHKEIIWKFATYINVTNFKESCAAGELAVTLLKRKVSVIDQSSKSNKTKVEIEQQILQDLNVNNELSNFSDCLDYVKTNYRDSGLTFSDFWSAATHYEKHGKNICNIMKVNPPSLQGYIQLAREVKENHLKVSKIWSQNGTSLFKRYEANTDVCKLKLILSEHFISKKERIITFYVDEQFNYQ